VRAPHNLCFWVASLIVHLFMSYTDYKDQSFVASDVVDFLLEGTQPLSDFNIGLDAIHDY
jgi:hypothetical protein